MSEQLFNTVQTAGLPIGVSVLCPGWVRTNIADAERNWPADLGAKPDQDPVGAVTFHHFERALAEGRTPASVADAVLDAIAVDRFWVIPHQDFLDLCIERWATIAERIDPQPPEDVSGRAAALADPRRGRRRPRPRGPRGVTDVPLTARRPGGIMVGDRSSGTCRTDRGAIFEEVRNMRFAEHVERSPPS